MTDSADPKRHAGLGGSVGCSPTGWSLGQPTDLLYTLLVIAKTWCI